MLLKSSVNMKLYYVIHITNEAHWFSLSCFLSLHGDTIIITLAMAVFYVDIIFLQVFLSKIQYILPG